MPYQLLHVSPVSCGGSEPAHCIAVRYCESTIRRSSSFARGSAAAERSIAAPEFQNSRQCFSAESSVAPGSQPALPARRKPQQKANPAPSGVSTNRCAESFAACCREHEFCAYVKRLP